MSYLMGLAQNKDRAPDGRPTIGNQVIGDDPNSMSPDQIMAMITREQFLDSQQFHQFEDMLSSMILDPERNEEMRQGYLRTAEKTAAGAFNRAESRTRTHNSRSGTLRSAADQKIDNRKRQVNKTAAMVKSRNDTRGFLNNLENELIGI